MNREVSDTHQKALQINLDPNIYGTFAEIGAGQEVARWFFRVGGAAGTIAKAMSAYDMTFSDAIYGTCDRYVSKQRINSMLNHEFRLLYERLDSKRTQVLDLAQRYGARNVRMIGSVARGEAGPDSDLDLLVDLERGRSLLDQAALMIELEKLLGCKVDVATDQGLRSRVRERVLKEAVPL